MRKAKISFRVIGDSGPLTLSWFDGPKGDAVEAKNGIGVGFFSHDGTLLCVEFDDVNMKRAQQILEFDRCRISVSVKDGEISYSLSHLGAPKKPQRSLKKRDVDAT